MPLDIGQLQEPQMTFTPQHVKNVMPFCNSRIDNFNI